MNSLKDEIDAIITARAVPYHKVSLVLALILAVLFTVIYSNNYIEEAGVAVIDLDNSRAAGFIAVY